MVYFSELKGRPVFDSKYNRVGRIRDLIFVDGRDYAEVVAITCAANGAQARIPWDCVHELKPSTNQDKLHLIDVTLTVAGDCIPEKKRKNELHLSKLLDRQVVDVEGAKVVRVNDVILGKVDGKFGIVAVAVGTPSLVRRLIPGKVMDPVASIMRDNIIPWSSVQRLEKKVGDIHLTEDKKSVAHMHAGDIANLMEDLSPNQRALLFGTLDHEKAAKTLLRLDPLSRASVLHMLSEEDVMEILESVSPDKAAALLANMAKGKRMDYLRQMKSEKMHNILEILSYSSKSAAAIMDTSFISVKLGSTAQQTIRSIRTQAKKLHKLHHVYVVRKDNTIAGVISLRDLIMAKPTSRVSSFMRKDVLSVSPKTSREEVAMLIARYDLLSVPVVTEKNIIIGEVNSDDVVSALIPQRLKHGKYVPQRPRKKHAAKKKSKA